MKTLKTLRAIWLVVKAAVAHARGEITSEQLRDEINKGRVMIGREPLKDGDD